MFAAQGALDNDLPLQITKQRQRGNTSITDQFIRDEMAKKVRQLQDAGRSVSRHIVDDGDDQLRYLVSERNAEDSQFADLSTAIGESSVVDAVFVRLGENQ